MVHNTAQNSSDNLPSYPPDNHLEPRLGCWIIHTSRTSVFRWPASLAGHYITINLLPPRLQQIKSSDALRNTQIKTKLKYKLRLYSSVLSDHLKCSSVLEEATCCQTHVVSISIHLSTSTCILYRRQNCRQFVVRLLLDTSRPRHKWIVIMSPR